MSNQTEKMADPKNFNYRPPDINLPFTRNYNLLFSYYYIDRVNNGPIQTATCKLCEKVLNMISGSTVYSSYTFGLTFHLKTHPEEWVDYMGSLAGSMNPDSTRLKYEHFKQMSRTKRNSTEESTRRLRECCVNSDKNRKNCAGIDYRFRDSDILKNNLHNLVDDQNARIFKYLHKFTNQNLTLYDLMGIQHHGANRNRNYLRSKCLVDNIENLTADLEKFLCQNMCFFDPEFFEDCPSKHTGDISVFADKNYQDSFPNFKAEIEQYPEFLDNTSFSDTLLKDVKVIEHDRIAVIEMNRLLKIILSLVVVQEPRIKDKLNDLISNSKDDKNLFKPLLALHMWGPKYSDIDVSSEEDKSKTYSESMFSTFKHENNEDCPAFHDQSKKLHDKPYLEDEKVIYPCNIGGCGKACECAPCNSDGEILQCPDHHPDHPLLFDPEEDISISRRILFDPVEKKPIFKRPIVDSELCPPKLKKNCNICKRIVTDHLRNHHSLHSAVCEICNHMEYISKNSFKLICPVCMKIFESKYRLEDHMNLHNTKNPYFCKSCDRGFTTKFNYEKHVLENHDENQETYECDKCSETFTLERNLKRHKDDIHSEKNQEEYTCELCQKSFKQRYNLLKHKRIEHNLNERKAVLPGVNDDEIQLVCTLCNRTFKQQFTLDRHLETMHSNNNHKCRTCRKCFNRKDNLQRHEKIHLKRPVKIICEICKKQFKSADGLKAHFIGNHE